MDMGIEDTNKNIGSLVESMFNCRLNNMSDDSQNNQDLNEKNPTKPILLIKGPPDLDSQNEIYSQGEVDSRDEIQKEASTMTLISDSLIDTNHQSRNSDSDDEMPTKSLLDVQKQYVEDERKWLKYKVDSLSKDQAIVFCVLGQMLLSMDDVLGSRQDVPLPDEAKQILLNMTYGDHWSLKDLSIILGFQEKVNSLVSTWGGLLEWPTITRKSLESLIMRHIGITRTESQLMD